MGATFQRSVILCSALWFCLFTFAQDSVQITMGDGTAFSVGENTDFDMKVGDNNVEEYTLTPSDPQGIATLTITATEKGKDGPVEVKTVATGKKITLWRTTDDKSGKERADFRIEGDGRVIRGKDKMVGPKSIEYKDLKLDIFGVDGKDGELDYTFGNQRIDWQGQEFHATFRLDENGQPVLKGSHVPPSKRLNFYMAGMKGGVGHLIPAGSPPKSDTGAPSKKVSPN